jgi:hypothetical protein
VDSYTNYSRGLTSCVSAGKKQAPQTRRKRYNGAIQAEMLDTKLNVIVKQRLIA